MSGETLLPLSYQDSDVELRCKFDIYVWPKRKPLYVNNVINKIYILEMWELLDIMNSSIIQDIFKLPHFQNTYRINNIINI